MNKHARTAILLSLPILCAAIGYFGMKAFLSTRSTEPVMPDPIQTEAAEKTFSGSGEAEQSATTEEKNKTEEEISEGTEAKDEEQSEQTERFSFDSLSVFTVQVGSYSTISNADRHKEQLIEAGKPAYIYSGKNHRVLVGGYASREMAEAVREEIVATDAPDAFVTVIKQVPGAIDYSIVEESQRIAFQKITRAYVTRLNQLSALMEQMGYAEPGDVADWLNNDKVMVKNLLQSCRTTGDMGDFDNALQNMISQLERDQELLGKASIEDVTGLDLAVIWMDSLFGYSDIQ